LCICGTHLLRAFAGRAYSEIILRKYGERALAGAHPATPPCSLPGRNFGKISSRFSRFALKGITVDAVIREYDVDRFVPGGVVTTRQRIRPNCPAVILRSLIALVISQLFGDFVEVIQVCIALEHELALGKSVER
jgi:hypothetical protein